MILLGGGVNHARAYEKIAQIAETLKIPVITTLMGISAISRECPYYCGMIGLHGSVAANYATSNCDFLLNLGARFDDRTTIVSGTFATEAVIAHVDIDPAEIGKNIDTRIPIVADINAFLEEFMAHTRLTCLSFVQPEQVSQLISRERACARFIIHYCISEAHLHDLSLKDLLV